MGREIVDLSTGRTDLQARDSLSDGYGTLYNFITICTLFVSCLLSCRQSMLPFPRFQLQPLYQKIALSRYFIVAKCLERFKTRYSDFPEDSKVTWSTPFRMLADSCDNSQISEFLYFAAQCLTTDSYSPLLSSLSLPLPSSSHYLIQHLRHYLLRQNV